MAERTRSWSGRVEAVAEENGEVAAGPLARNQVEVASSRMLLQCGGGERGGGGEGAASGWLPDAGTDARKARPAASRELGTGRAFVLARGELGVGSWRRLSGKRNRCAHTRFSLLYFL